MYLAWQKKKNICFFLSRRAHVFFETPNWLIANLTNVGEKGEKESKNGKEMTQFLRQKQIQANDQMS